MSTPNTKRTPVKIIVWVAVCVIVGAFLSASFFVMEARGYFEQWHELANAPSGAIELLSDETGAIYVKTSSEETYRLEWHEGGKRWGKNEVSQNAKGQPVEEIKPCDFSSPEFSLFANVPKDIIDCTQTVDPQPDGFVRYAHVLDKGGTVWYWYTAASADPSVIIMFACIVAFGATAGLSTGVGTSLVGMLIRAIKRM